MYLISSCDPLTQMQYRDTDVCLKHYTKTYYGKEDLKQEENNGKTNTRFCSISMYRLITHVM